MFQKLLSFLFTPFLIVAACAASKTPFNAIQRLERVGTTHYCTTWATRVNDMTRWVTAAHCVAKTLDADGEPTEEVDEKAKYTIGGKAAHLIRLNEISDLALFMGPEANGLQVSNGDAEVGQKVKEYSFFVDSGFYSEGVAGIPLKNDFRIFNLTAGSGASGGPVLTEDNLVVGVMQFVLCQGARGSACPIVGGAGVHMIRNFLQE